MKSKVRDRVPSCQNTTHTTAWLGQQQHRQVWRVLTSAWTCRNCSESSLMPVHVTKAYVYPKLLTMILLTICAPLELSYWLATYQQLTITQRPIRDARCSAFQMSTHAHNLRKKNPKDLLNIVVKTTNHVLTSNNASTTCSFLNFRFSVPPWSSRTLSSAAMRSSFVSIFACTGESGSQMRTQIPTTMASPPRRMKMTRNGASRLPSSKEMPFKVCQVPVGAWDWRVYSHMRRIHRTLE